MGKGEGSGEGAGSCISKCLLIIINIAFALIGVGICAAGVCIKYLLGNGLVDFLLDFLQELGLSTTAASTDSKATFGEFLEGLAIPLIVFGLALLIIAILGMCGACCSSRCILILYVIIMLIVILAEIIVVVLVVTEVVLTDWLQGQLQTSYVGIDGIDDASVFFNIIMLKLNCCGVYRYTDFNNAVKWQKTRYFNVSGQTITLAVPVLCCARDASEAFDQSCIHGNLTSTNSHIDMGCYQAVLDLIKPYEMYIILVLVGVFVLELILLIMSIYVILDETDKGKDKIIPF